MATTKISQFPTMSVSDVDSANDVLPIVDTNLGSNKKITLDNLGSSITASHAISASYALNGGSGGGTTNTGSLIKTGSVDLNTLTFTKGNGDEFNLVVDTGSSFWVEEDPFTISVEKNVIVRTGDFLATDLISGSVYQVSSDGRISFLDNTGGAGEITFRSNSFSLNESTQVTGSLRISGSTFITGSLIVSGSQINVTEDGTISTDNTVSTKNLFSSGSVKRKVREVTLTTANSTGGGGMPSIQPDDDIILVVGSTVGLPGPNDYTLNCGDIFYGNTSEIGRTVTIVNASSAVGSDIILGSPTPGGNYTANGVSTTGAWSGVCGGDFTEVTIVLRASNSVIIYGSGMI